MKTILVAIGGLVVGALGGSLLSSNLPFSRSDQSVSTKSLRNQNYNTEDVKSSHPAVQTTTGPLNRVEALINKYRGFTSQAFAHEISTLSRQPGSEDFLTRILLFSAWAEQSPEEALSFINKNPQADLGGRGGGMTKRLIDSA